MLKEVCERRGKQAEVADFIPNDLSRSAEALTEHRKAVKKRAAKQADEVNSSAERLLYEGTTAATPDASSETICFPFHGLSI
jgi:hypothetical protein